MSRKKRRVFTLLASLSDLLRRETEGVTREFLEGATWGDSELLGCIYFDHDGVVRPSELVGIAYSTATGVTGSLRRLEDAGLIERKRTEEDRRVLLVCLTDLGRETIESAGDGYDALAERRLGDLSEDEIDWLFDFLTRQFGQ